MVNNFKDLLQNRNLASETAGRMVRLKKLKEQKGRWGDSLLQQGFRFLKAALPDQIITTATSLWTARPSWTNKSHSYEPQINMEILQYGFCNSLFLKRCNRRLYAVQTAHLFCRTLAMFLLDTELVQEAYTNICLTRRYQFNGSPSPLIHM